MHLSTIIEISFSSDLVKVTTSASSFFFFKWSLVTWAIVIGIIRGVEVDVFIFILRSDHGIECGFQLSECWPFLRLFIPTSQHNIVSIIKSNLVNVKQQV